MVFVDSNNVIKNLFIIFALTDIHMLYYAIIVLTHYMHDDQAKQLPMVRMQHHSSFLKFYTAFLIMISG